MRTSRFWLVFYMENFGKNCKKIKNLDKFLRIYKCKEVKIGKNCMKKIVLIVMFGLAMFGISSATTNVFASDVNPDEKRVVDLLAANLNEFKSEYNEKFDEPLLATGIEGYCSAYLVDAHQNGVYIDFNGNNGYLVTTLDFEIYGMETTGDLAYLKNEDFVYYSTVDGFLYYEDSHYKKYDSKDLNTQLLYDKGSSSMEEKNGPVYGYAGQSGSGEAEIYDLDKYIKARYSSYKLVKKNDAISKAGYIPHTMSMTSYFRKWISNDGGYTYPYMETERCCALTAIVNVMRAWKKMNYLPNLPTDTVTRDIREELKSEEMYLYRMYGVNKPGVGYICYWTTNTDYNLEHVPELYYWARYYATSNCKYTPESGLTTDNVIYLLNATTSKYNSTVSGGKTTTFTDVMSHLDAGRAVFMGVANSTSFGEDHAVALLGYAQYTYTTGVWIFSKTHTAYFYLIDDGRYGTVEYFDPNCNSELSYEFVYPRV